MNNNVVGMGCMQLSVVDLIEQVLKLIVESFVLFLLPTTTLILFL